MTDMTQTQWHAPLSPAELDILNGAGAVAAQVRRELQRSDLYKNEKNLQVFYLPAPRVQELPTHCYFSAKIPGAVMVEGDFFGQTRPKYRDIQHVYADVALNRHLMEEDGKSAAIMGWVPDTDLQVTMADGIDDRTDFVRFAWAAYSGRSFDVNADPWMIQNDVHPAISTDTKAVTNEQTHDWKDGDRAQDITRVYYKGFGELERKAIRERERLNPEIAALTKIKDFVRPNGEKYIPRFILNGGPDKDRIRDVDLVATGHRNSIPVLLYGPPGTGKTALAESALDNLVMIAGSADTETADFLGTWVAVGKDEFEWVDGPLVVAAENGYPLFIDEIALIDSRQLAVVYSMMDGRNEFTIPTNPKRGVIKAKPGFYVIGACNPDVPGAVMSDALLSRFSIQLEVTTDYEVLKKLGVEAEIITVAQNLAEKVKNNDIMKAPQTRELLGYQKIKETIDRPTALANLISSADPNDREEYIRVISSTFAIKAVGMKV